MSKTLAIALVISASISGSFQTAMSGTRRTVEQLGGTIDDLTGRQKRLKDGIAALPSAYSLQFKGMMTRYYELGNMIDRLADKQKRLKDLSNEAVGLREDRQQLRGRMGEAVAGAIAVAAPAVQSVRRAANYEDQIKDIAITGNMSRTEESKLGKALRENAIRTNQTQEELARGTGILVANGMSPADAKRYSGILGKTATATRGQMEELAQFMFSLNTSFKIEGETDMKSAIDASAHAGKQGQFELKHMARYFPELGASMASFGSTGLKAVKELGMAMQIARKYAGTNEEAATNARNWFSHMTANTTVENFKKVGVDYRGEILKRMQQQKISSLQASLQVTDEYVDRIAAGKTISVKKGKKVEQLNFRTALNAARASGDEASIKSVVERFGLSKIFQDIQTLNFYMAMRQGKDLFKKGMATYDTAEAKGVIDRDFNKRMEASTEQFKKLRIQTAELGLAVGEALLPALTKTLSAITPVVSFVGNLAARFPRVTAAVIGLSTGLMVGRVAYLAAAYGVKSLMSTYVGLQTVIAVTQTKLALLRISMAGWSVASFIRNIRSATMAMRGFTMALVTNPFTVAIAAALAWGLVAYRVWKNWDVLKQPGFFKDLRNWIRDETLLGQLFQGGANLVSSIWKGMKSVAKKPVELTASITKKIRDYWPFSPAKEGALKDIHKMRLVETIAESIKPHSLVKAMRVTTAAAMLAAAPVAAHTQQINAVTPVASLARPTTSSAGGSQGMSITFSPQITIQGGNPEQIKGQVGEALQLSFAEFERMMKQYNNQKIRRSF